MYITTVFRREGERDKQGKIYAVDWEARPRRGTKVPLWEMDTGAVRGMAFVGEKLFVARPNELRTLDTKRGGYIDSWEYSELLRPHKLYYREDRNVFVLPSTGDDGLMTIDAETMKLVSKTHLANFYKDTLHFNSMGWDRNGHEYHLYHRLGTVVNATTKKTVFADLQGAHDLEFIDDRRVVINNTSERKTLVGDVQTGELKEIFEAEDGPSTAVSTWGGTRGAAYHNGLLFTGSFPVDIHLFDVNSWKRLNWVRLSTDREESLFDICLDPRDWP